MEGVADMVELKCSMPTGSLRMCSRTARYEYIRNARDIAIVGPHGDPIVDTIPDQTIAALCAQHHRAGGHSRMLRPRPWEYDRIFDRAAGFNIHERGVRDWPRLGEAT